MVLKQHCYILKPVIGNARYTKLRVEECRNMGQSLQKAFVNLEDVTLCLSKDGYKGILRLADNFAAFNQRLKYAQHHPHVPIKVDARSWWKYAYNVVTNEMKAARKKTKTQGEDGAGHQRRRRGKRLGKEIYASLCHPNPFDDGTKMFWQEKYKGGVCMSMSSKALSITGIDDRRYWNYIPTEESRTESVANWIPWSCWTPGYKFRLLADEKPRIFVGL